MAAIGNTGVALRPSALEAAQYRTRFLSSPQVPPRHPTKMAARPATPASPKNYKIKSPQPGQPVYGCGKTGPFPAFLAISNVSRQNIYSASSTKTRRRRIPRYNITRPSCVPSSTRTRSFHRRLNVSTARSSRRSPRHICVYNALRPSPKTTGQNMAVKNLTDFVCWASSQRRTVRLTNLAQTSIQEVVLFTARCATTSSGTQHLRSSG